MIRLIFLSLMAALLSACSETGLTPQKGYIEVAGGKVWYQVAGSGKATPLLLLHGGPGATSHYLKPLQKVAVDRPVIFYARFRSVSCPGR